MYDAVRSPPPPDNPADKQVPPAFYDALRRTPRGLFAKARLKQWFAGNRSDGKKLEVDLVGKPPGGAHGDTQDLHDRVLITIDVDKNNDDRMSGWSRDEILNVVGVHEIAHLIKIRDIFVDGCSCGFGSCHQPHFEQELMSRIQYSLIQGKAMSSGKAGWLQAYKGYFAAARMMARDAEYVKMCVVGKTGPSHRQIKAIKKYEAENPPRPTAEDLQFGEARVFEIYKAAVTEMKDAAAAFASDGLCDDLTAYRAVMSKFDDYQMDTAFERLLP
jgi:hypothetical protein